jgi:uncharacterized protein (DUF1330 family)
MPAYIIVEVEVKDPVAYEKYKAQVPATLPAYGGKFIVRGGKSETLEGGWSPQRIVVVEFPSVDRAKAWWNSKDYAPVKAIRYANAKSKMIVVEGYTSPKLG